MLPVSRNSIINRFFDDFSRDLFDVNTNELVNRSTYRPSVNIKENDNGFILEFAAPGLSKEDFKVELVNNVLTISAEKKEAAETKEEKFLRKEFSYQSFKRSFNLDENKVQEDQISANYVDGVLKVDLPKREEVKAAGPKLIEVA